jgi:hypothetical protein
MMETMGEDEGSILYNMATSDDLLYMHSLESEGQTLLRWNASRWSLCLGASLAVIFFSFYFFIQW